MMSWESFEQFFVAATGHATYPFQRRLAVMPDWPMALHVPTGLGKTAGVSLSYVWRRQFHPTAAIRQNTPRRLVYCLPMRVLVEQTRDCILEYLSKTGLLQRELPEAANPGSVSVHVLMGGDQDDEALLYPASQAIIVGTQDMLLSRALNRGYGMSRFRWPAAFGLLNNDCLWVFDEVQLMGTALATSAQLAAFRDRFGTFGHCQSLWLSATLQPSWIQTVDHAAPRPDAVLRLGDDDRAQPTVGKRLNAVKTLHRWHGGALPTSRAYYGEVASSAIASHKRGTLTLVIVNTVARAKGIYLALLAQIQKSRPTVKPDPLLIHSRFRPPDRELQMQALRGLQDAMPAEGFIVVATQCVEAGIDISARTLFTELAPWASLVQRFGRDNRAGEYEGADVFWIDLCPANDREGPSGKPKLEAKVAAPYEVDDLLEAREHLIALEGLSVAPAALPQVAMPYAPQHVIRAKDLVDLFDTTPDLSGNDIDVSRFIRDGAELDVTVFWRGWDAGAPLDRLPGPRRSELCAAPLSEAREHSRDREVWRWDHLRENWLRCRPHDIRPVRSSFSELPREVTPRL